MSFAGNRQQVESYKTEAVPQSLQGNDSPASMKGRVRQVAVPSTTSDQRSNGKLKFVLPNNNVAISRSSMFLKARVSVSFTTTLPGQGAIASSIWFQGPGPSNVTGGNLQGYAQNSSPNNISTISMPIIGNAYSLIQRSTLYCGSEVVDRIDYVCDLMSGLILPHATSTDWVVGDGSSLLAILTPPYRSTTLSVGGYIYWDVCIPITHSCLNSENNFPLYLLSDENPLSLEIDLTSFNRAIGYGTTTATYGPILEYTLSKVALSYQSIELPNEFIQSQRLATKKIPFVIPQLSYMINLMPISALSNYNCVLKMSSLRGVYILPFNGANYVSTYANNATVFAYTRNANDNLTSGVFGGSGFDGTNVQLYCDGELINKINLDNPVLTFVELKQALKNSITSYSGPSLGNSVVYKLCYYAIGINTTLFSDGSTIMNGTPVNEAQIVLTNMFSSSTSAYLANIIFAYDSLIIIKNGKITTKR